MVRQFIFALLLAAVLAPLSSAQMRGGFHGGARGVRSAGSSAAHHRSAIPFGYFVGDTPFLYDDYPFGSVTAESPAPQFIVMPAPAAPDTAQVKAAPLLIELQGNRYVRYGGVARSPQPDTPANELPARQSMIAPEFSGQSSARSAPLPHTVLVYRDGHREEIPAYAIVGQVIYAHNHSNDGQTGYGMKNIQLSELDIPATRNANRENGVPFTLPSGPNEVVTRP
ncbi:MAG: hypothetical protein ABSG70_01640 [Terriglobales bacterium]|jgi:hypothetical protein